MFKNLVSKYIPYKIKVALSKKLAILLCTIRKFTSIYVFDKFIITLCFKANEFERIKKIISNHKEKIDYCRFLERVLRYEALGDNIYKKNFVKERTLSFHPKKYQELLNENKKLITKFPNDYLLHDRLARNYVAGGYTNKAKFHFSESLKLQRKIKCSKGKSGIIILISMPRSGTGFVARSIQNGLNLRSVEIPNLDSWYPHYSVIDIPNYVNYWYFSGMPDGFWGGHTSAFKSTLSNLSLITDKIIVNFRDLRQQLISFAHYMEYLRLTGNHTGLIKYQIPDGYFIWSFEKQLDWQIENYCVPVNINWIKGWLKADQDPEFPCEILFCQYEMLAKNPKQYFKNILSFYGVSEEKFKYPLAPKFKEGTHMRKGEADEWKKVLKPEQIQKINNLIPESWFRRFGWDKSFDK